MRPGLLFSLACLACFPGIGRAQELPKNEASEELPIPDFERFEPEASEHFNHLIFDYASPVKDPKGILLFVKEAGSEIERHREEDWLWLAVVRGWAMVSVEIEAAEGVRTNLAIESLESEFFRWLDGASPWKESTPKLPIVLHGSGKAGTWFHRMLLRQPRRFKAWVMQGWPAFPAVDGEIQLPPGLLISDRPGYDINYRRHWEALRRSDPANRVILTALGSQKLDRAYVDELAVEFLDASAGDEFPDEQWLHFYDETPMPEELEEGIDVTEYAWFPNEAVAGTWKILCASRPFEPKPLVKVWSKVWKSGPFEKIEVHQNRLAKEPKGVLLFTLTDSKDPLVIFRDKNWIDFARRNQWSLMVLNLKEARRVRDDQKATELLEKRLFAWMDAGPWKPKAPPVILHSSGKAGYWMHRLMLRQPGRFKAWFTQGCTVFPAITVKDQRVPAGVLGVINEDHRFSHIFYLEDLRRTHRLNRVSMLVRDQGNVQQKYYDDWTRQYFEAAAVEKLPRGIWLNFKTGQSLTLNNRDEADPADFVWFPNRSVKGSWDLLCRARPQMPLPEIVKSVVKTRLAEHPEMNLFVRIPGRAKNGIQPKGVFCFCTWQKADSSLVNRLKNPMDPLVQFADRNDLAMITWNTAALLPPGIWVQELDEQEERELMAKFDRIGQSWLDGVQKICRKYKLPEKDFFLHGVSRGSTYAHRLALRHPDKFLAVHTHIANHYEAPNQKSRDLLWLATTGELDGGYMETRQFYQDAKELDFPILIKAGPSLGHAMRDDIEKLSLQFFDYALFLKDWAERLEKEGGVAGQTKKTTPADLFREEIKTARFFGDFINHEVYPNGEADWIPESQRIPLPDEKLAEAWGVAPEKGL